MSKLLVLVVAVFVNSFFFSSGVCIGQYGNNNNDGNVRYQPCTNCNSNSEEDFGEYYNPNNCNSAGNCGGNCARGRNEFDDNYYRRGCDCSYPNSYPNNYPGSCNGGRSGAQCGDALQRFNDGVLSSGLQLFKAYVDSRPRKTGVISPLFTLFTLAVLAIFGEGETEREVYEFINLSNEQEIECVFNRINYELLNLPCSIEFKRAAIYVGDRKKQFTDDFKDALLNIIGGEALNVDFRNSTLATNIVNGQVVLETGTRVRDIIVDRSVFNSSTELARITGTFFSSPWAIEFQISQRITEFCVAPGRSVPGVFYTQVAVYDYAYSSELNAQAIRLNYLYNRFYVLVVVPNIPFTERHLLDIMLQDPTGWYERLCSQMRPTKVDVTVPVFSQATISDTRSLNIEGTDLKTIYDARTIKLSGAIENDEPAGVSVAYQKNVIRIPSDGCPVQNCPPGEAVTFVANIPHFVFLFITATNTPLYIGYTNGPTDGL